MINDSTVVVGVGERTSAAAVQLCARRLFEAKILDVIEGSHDRGTASRAQWDERTNLLAVAPGP